MSRRREMFPAKMEWPVTPTDAHWLDRHHWLKDEHGDLHLAAWHYSCGWHFDISGPADPEDVEGWTYVAPVEKPSVLT